MIKRVLAIAALLMMTTSTTACSPLAAICGAWLATPCIICLGDGTTDNPPPGAVDVSAELPMTTPTTPNTSTTMQY